MPDSVISVRVSLKRLWDLKSYALAQDLTISSLVNAALDEYISRHPLSTAQKALQQAWIDLQMENRKKAMEED